MILLEKVSIRRGPRLLFQDANEQIHPRERVGVVGQNGSGKSSLFSLFLGELQPDHGEIHLPAGWTIAHVAQEAPDGKVSALNYVLQGDAELCQLEKSLAEVDHGRQGQLGAELLSRMEQIDGYGARARAARLLHGLGFATGDHDSPVVHFSGGWRVRLSLARALMCRSDLLLLDEPTNHLDLDAVVWLEDWVRNYTGTLLLISHDRDFLDAVCGRILHIEHQAIRSYSGNYSRFEQTRAQSLALEQASYNKQEKAVAHLETYIRRFRAKASKARQAQSRLKALERMQRIAPAHVRSPFSFDFKPPGKASDPLVRLEDVSTGYDSTTILDHLELAISGRDRITLVGPNGAGKSTLIRLLAGNLQAGNGQVTRSRNLKTGYFAQHQLEQLDPGNTPLGQMSTMFPGENPQQLRDFLGGFGFVGDRVNEPIAPLSGGEKARLALAQLVYRGPNLLLMDEPTNHLDLEMRHALTMAFQDYQGAIVLVSHDRHLIRTVSDDLWLVNDRKVTPFDGDIDDYLLWVRRYRTPDNAKPADDQTTRTAGRPNRKSLRQESAKKRARRAPLLREIRSTENSMEAARLSIGKLDAVLQDPDTYESRSTADLAQLMQNKSRLEEDIIAWEEKWLTLSEELEDLEKSA